MNAIVLVIVLAPAQIPSPGSPDDARARRARRETAVTIVGTEARPMVEELGEVAVNALLAVPTDTAKQLALFHNEGKLARLPRPKDLLVCIAREGHGRDVAAFALKHHEALQDVDAFDAFLAEPMEYALGLKPLADGAAAVRARRLSGRKDPQWWEDWRHLALAGAAVAIAVLGVREWRRRSAPGIP